MKLRILELLTLAVAISCLPACAAEDDEASEEVAEASSELVAATPSLVNQTITKELIAKITPAKLDATVATLSAYTTRYYRTATGQQSADRLFATWSELVRSGSNPLRITVEQYKHTWAQSSLVVTVPGSTTPSDVWVVGAHLDSINAIRPMTARAPGADDGASGIAVLTETLRILVSGAYKPKSTIKIIAYSANEAGLLGSSAIANAYKAAGVKVAGVLDLGVVGFPIAGKPNIGIITDNSDATQNAFLRSVIAGYVVVPTGDVTCGYACADHASWAKAGFKASAVFESTNLDGNTTVHTERDTVVDSQHIARFVKLALGYLAEKTSISR